MTINCKKRKAQLQNCDSLIHAETRECWDHIRSAANEKPLASGTDHDVWCR